MSVLGMCVTGCDGVTKKRDCWLVLMLVVAGRAGS